MAPASATALVAMKAAYRRGDGTFASRAVCTRQVDTGRPAFVAVGGAQINQQLQFTRRVRLNARRWRLLHS